MRKNHCKVNYFDRWWYLTGVYFETLNHRQTYHRHIYHPKPIVINVSMHWRCVVRWFQQEIGLCNNYRLSLIIHSLSRWMTHALYDLNGISQLFKEGKDDGYLIITYNIAYQVCWHIMLKGMIQRGISTLDWFINGNSPQPGTFWTDHDQELITIFDGWLTCGYKTWWSSRINLFILKLIARK